MLVLSRKVGETVVIGENIKVTIVRVQGNKVRLGIEAPTEVPVNRGEVNASLRRHGEKHIHEKKDDEVERRIARVFEELEPILPGITPKKGTVVNGGNTTTKSIQCSEAIGTSPSTSTGQAEVPVDQGPDAGAS